jgi:hypothetical protein
MPAPTLSVDGTSLTVPVIPFRRYGYALITAAGDDWDGASISVRQQTEDDQIELAAHTENGGNEILVTTDTIKFQLSGTPGGAIAIRLGEITGK